MKLLTFAFMATMSCLVYVPASHGADLAQNICEYVAVDEKSRLRKVLKSNRLKLRNVFKDIRCNNDNLLIFAARKNAMEVGELLIKKLPKAVVESDLDNVAALSPQLAEIAKARIQ